ncbi:hypothetical protein [Cellulosilyticum ruminicola]|uniref:hypothetical protein n=1 Tax=Cellulosilyticum ruminicola TaxID=425254 RepID=UPI0006D0B2A4|nr:hypothetical protein [Cellulosilyticum ruminicola]
MLRPIDTQTVYQQTQEIAAREQMYKQAQILQQDQFSELLKKEVSHKQDKVNEMQKGEQVDNDLNKNKNKNKNKKHGNDRQKENARSNTPKKKQTTIKDEQRTSIDIRI